MESKKKKLTGQQGELMRALDITAEDLLANDEGYISQGQKDSVVTRQTHQLMPVFLMAFIFIAVAVFIPSIILLTGKSADKLNFGLILSAFFLVIAVAVSGFAFWQRQRLKRELKQNSIQTTQGIVVVNTTFEESFLEINGIKLNSSPDILRRVQHLQPYMIHYLPESKAILSMEHIPEENNIRMDASQSRLQDEYHSASTEHDEVESKKQDSTSM